MKQLLLILSIAIFITGCESNNDEYSSENSLRSNSFNFVIEPIANNNITKAHLEGLKVVFDNDDKIAIFDNNTAKSEYSYSAATGKFSGESLKTGEGLNGIYALYPSSACTSCNSEKITGTLPAKQIYKANSFATNSHIMYAKCDALADEIELKNMVSYVRLHLYTADDENIVVKEISLSTNNGKRITGDFYIDNTTTDTPKLIMSEVTSNSVNIDYSSVTLDCSAEEGGGVKLSNSSDEPTVFYICMPVQNYEEGFTINITDISGNTFTKSASTPLDLKRNTIKPMAALKIFNMINEFPSDATIENKEYILGNLENSLEYGVTKGNTLTIKNTTYKGEIGYISFGIYPYRNDPNKGHGNYTLENVTIKDLTVNSKWGITNNGRVISIGAFIYGGTSKLKNCTMTGTKLVGPKNSNGDFVNQYNSVIDDWYDCAIVNFVIATIDGGEYGKLYTYEHAKTTITGDVKINTLTTATIPNSKGYLKIDGGTIEKIVVIPVGASYPPTIKINAGATVKEIDFSGSKTTNFVNNSGQEITIGSAATTE